MLKWLRTATTAFAVIRILVALAATSGGAMTLALLAEMRWYTALTIGAFFTACLLSIVVAIDYLWRIYTVSKKIVVTQFTVSKIEVDPVTHTRTVFLYVHVKNTAVRPIYFLTERISCHLSNHTHDKYEPWPKALQIQVDNSGSAIVPPIPDLPDNTQIYKGFVDIEVKYGKDESVPLTYKTHADFELSMLAAPSGRLVGAIQVIGGTGSYS